MAYEWAVIGAGPAGIAAVGRLIDFGVKPKHIAWIDPSFTVGDFGGPWRNVPGNTKVRTFLDFLQGSPAFRYAHCPQDFALNHVNPEETCDLRFMADPLQWVTQHLKETVLSVQGIAKTLRMGHQCWIVETSASILEAKNVILAVGSEPKQLSYPSVPVIPLQVAMDRDRIHRDIDAQDTIAVFGSSHSAILTLRNLLESRVARVINFYRSPLRYAVYLPDWILFDDTGLKGTTADWAREHIVGQHLSDRLTRVYSNEENIEHYLPQCDKAIYAVGFERRLLPVIQDLGHVDYVEQCGIIAPGLFGLGIAFPEAKYNPLGLLEYRAGLWKFMEYLNRILPVWMQYPA